MNTSDALNYYRQIKNSFSGEEVAPGAIPQGFVANWGGTAVYKKGTFLGRLWQVIHLFAGTEETAMRNAIRKIVEVARATLNQDQMEAESALQDLAENEPLNEWWASHTVTELKEGYHDAIRFRSFRNAVSWAQNMEDDEIDHIAKDHLLEGMELEKEWHVFTKDIPISLLARELRTDYSRDKVEAGITEGCPAYLLYAPLVAIAFQLSDVPKTRFDELRELFNDIASNNNAGDLILKIVKYFHTPDAESDLPQDLVEVLKDLKWVAGCTLDKSYSLPITTHLELQKISVDYSVSVLGCGTGGKVQLPTTVTHTTNYCYQRFPERITIVDRYPYLNKELSNKK